MAAQKSKDLILSRHVKKDREVILAQNLEGHKEFDS